MNQKREIAGLRIRLLASLVYTKDDLAKARGAVYTPALDSSLVPVRGEEVIVEFSTRSVDQADIFTDPSIRRKTEMERSR